MARMGIIGGTGFTALLERAEPLTIETPWGNVLVGILKQGSHEVVLLRRHGEQHVAPHRIVHRANVEAMARCGVDAIFALNAVGALHDGLAPGSLLVPDDYVDLRRRHETFHDEGAVHVDVGEAYCPTLRGLLLRHAAAQGMPAHDGGVYVATEGPRLETRAEVAMLRQLGGSVVGMTGCPEAALARERALCYASLCLVTNPAAGVSPGKLTAQALKAGAEALGPAALRVALRAAREVTPHRGCACRRALEGARI